MEALWKSGQLSSRCQEVAVNFLVIQMLFLNTKCPEKFRVESPAYYR